jgi:hypothetical protein
VTVMDRRPAEPRRGRYVTELDHPDADSWLPVVEARVNPDGSWEVRCPDCARPNNHGPLIGFRVSHCHCEGMRLNRQIDGYVIAPPGAELMPYPDHCRDCRDLFVYTPVDLLPSATGRGLLGVYTCDRSHGWECWWGDNPLGIAATAPAPLQRDARKCALYRHYDEDGVLLYIGISYDLVARGRQHAKEAAWIEYAVRVEAEWLPSRDAAEAAERRAIQIEQPVFNFTYSLLPPEDLVAAYLAKRRKAAS